MCLCLQVFRHTITNKAITTTTIILTISTTTMATISSVVSDTEGIVTFDKVAPSLVAAAAAAVVVVVVVVIGTGENQQDIIS